MSNDTANCGCEGHCENFTACKYPEAVGRINDLEETLKSVLRNYKDELADHLAEHGDVIRNNDGTGQTLQTTVEWLQRVLKGKINNAKTTKNQSNS